MPALLTRTSPESTASRPIGRTHSDPLVGTLSTVGPGLHERPSVRLSSARLIPYSPDPGTSSHDPATSSTFTLWTTESEAGVSHLWRTVSIVSRMTSAIVVE